MRSTLLVFCAVLLTCSAQDFPPTLLDLPSTCAAILCEVGTRCEEFINEDGVMKARCVSAGPSCATVRCGFGQQCVMRKVQCIRAPCYPRPVCVYPEDMGERPGTCPKSSGLLGICVFDPNVNCLQDAECPIGQKCCSEGCGKICKAAVQSVVKPGQCPKPRLQAAVCPPSSCEQDVDCKGQDKCCKSPCGSMTCQQPQTAVTDPPPTPSCLTVKCRSGYECVQRTIYCIRAPCPQPPPVCEPIKVKPGQCPKTRLQSTVCPPSSCEQDTDCKGQDKCCRSPCGSMTCQQPQTAVTDPPPTPSCLTVKCRSGYECVQRTIYCIRAPCPQPPPVCEPIKPGRCPSLMSLSHTSFLCFRKQDRCQMDSQCRGGQKCCQTLCGKWCQDPETSPPARTCALVDCLPDHACVMKLRCDRKGCFPRPVCERVKRCPMYPAWINPNCVPRNTCSLEDPSSCPSGKLCCSTDCGRQCVTPV